MKFLKSSSTRSVLVLLCIALFCGAILSVLNDILYVSDDEIKARAFKKIYNKSEISLVDEILEEQFSTHESFGEVVSVNKAKDGTYILRTRGKGGYTGGTITLWLALRTDGQFDNIVIQSNEGQSYIANITQKYLTETFTNKTVKGFFTLGTADTDDIKVLPVSGTTRSSNAAVNAVNMALYYGRNALKIGENPEAEAIEKIKALNSEYENYMFISTPRYSSVPKTANVNGVSVSIDFIFASSAENQKDNIGFMFTADGVKIAAVANARSKTLMHAGIVDGQNVSSLENKTLAQLKEMQLSGDQAAALAAAIRAVEYVSNPYMAYISSFEAVVDGDTVTYKAKGISYLNSDPYTLAVIVKDSKIVGISITSSGWTWDGRTDKVEEGLASLTGKTLEGLDDVVFSQSTQSWTQIKRILTCCLTDYENRLGR